MSTSAQILANQANAQLSTGPRTATGRAISAQNNFRHGLTGPFTVLPWENQQDFATLQQDLTTEHQPATPTERILIAEMAQSHWLSQRAIVLQNHCLNESDPSVDNAKQLALYIRYGSTHHRAFHKALDQLQKLREQKRKQEIGFVSQNAREAEKKLAEERRQAQEKRREAPENRAQHIHQARVWLIEAQANRHETETTIAKFFKKPRTAGSAAA